MYRSFLIIIALVVCILAVQAGIPGVPKKITYQGILTYLDSKAKTKTFPDNKKTPYTVSFYFYDEKENGSWQTYVTQDIYTKKGVFEVTFGEQGDDMGWLNSAVFDKLLWVGMTITAGPAINGITYPYTVPGRIQLTSVPYAYAAEKAQVASSLASGVNISVAGIEATSSDVLAPVRAVSNYRNGTAIYSNAHGPSAKSVYSYADSGFSMYGLSGYVGVLGWGTGGYGTGVYGLGRYGGVYAAHYRTDGEQDNAVYLGTFSHSGIFYGPVNMPSMLSLSAATFKMDHPLDPENKYLSHAAVESPDMMNVYNGNVQLDASGEATVTLPDWFESLNSDFRYQLTSLGSQAPGLYIAQEVSANTFKIAGGKPGGKVSWQVTGIRQDAYAKANRVVVEEEKNTDEKGLYLHPELFNQPATKGIEYRDKVQMQKMREASSQLTGDGNGN